MRLSPFEPDTKDPKSSVAKLDCFDAWALLLRGCNVANDDIGLEAPGDADPLGEAEVGERVVDVGTSGIIIPVCGAL